MWDQRRVKSNSITDGEKEMGWWERKQTGKQNVWTRGRIWEIHKALHFKVSISLRKYHNMNKQMKAKKLLLLLQGRFDLNTWHYRKRHANTGFSTTLLIFHVWFHCHDLQRNLQFPFSIPNSSAWQMLIKVSFRDTIKPRELYMDTMATPALEWQSTGDCTPLRPILTGQFNTHRVSCGTGKHS